MRGEGLKTDDFILPLNARAVPQSLDATVREETWNMIHSSNTGVSKYFGQTG